MKKAAKIIICMITISIAITSCAFASSLFSGEDPTEKRVITEYCELYMYRSDRMKYSGLDFDIEPVAFPTVTKMFDNTISVSSAGGNVYVNPENMTIQRASLDFYNFNKTVEENDAYFVSAALGLSALEYGNIDDLMFGITKLNGSSSAAEESLRILSECFDTFVNGTGISQAFDGEKVLIYSGNYDYYIRYYNSTIGNSDYEVFWLEAEARD